MLSSPGNRCIPGVQVYFSEGKYGGNKEGFC